MASTFAGLDSTSFGPNCDQFIAKKSSEDKTIGKVVSLDEEQLFVHEKKPSFRVKLVSQTRAFNGYCEDLDRILKVATAGCTIVQAHRSLSGEISSEPCGHALNMFQTTSSMLGIVRVIPATIQLANFFTSNSGEKRPILDVITDVIFLVMRWLSPINWLHKIGAIDLGKHAANVGAAISSCIVAGVTLGFVSSVLDYINAKKEEFPQKLANLISNFFDMLSLPFDIGFLLNLPIMALVGGILMGVSGIVYLVTQLMGYKLIVPAQNSHVYAAAPAV